MAITNNCAKFLAYAKAGGVSFDNTLTLGRMLTYADNRYLQQLYENHKSVLSPMSEKKLQSNYAEAVFELLGTKSLKSLDYSAYENADITQDLNMAWPSQYDKNFSVVFDGGTLEHVFNFPVAIKSCMKAIKTGGHFIGITPANNQNGHGFYQFSPELYFRIFSAENGFRVIKMILTPDDKNWYEVTDPHEAKSRVLFTNKASTRLMVIAEKTGDKEIFLNSPYQSDYTHIWQCGSKNGSNTNNSRKKTIKEAIKKIIPAGLKNKLKNWNDVFNGRLKYTSDMGFINPAHLKKIEW
ncbi:methyltransferase domain-containing protein [Ferruginibacter profundus]